MRLSVLCICLVVIQLGCARVPQSGPEQVVEWRFESPPATGEKVALSREAESTEVTSAAGLVDDSIRVRIFPILRVPAGEPYPVTQVKRDLSLSSSGGFQISSIRIDGTSGSGLLVSQQIEVKLEEPPQLRLDSSSNWQSLTGVRSLRIRPVSLEAELRWDAGLPTEVRRRFRGEFVVEKTLHEYSRSGRLGCNVSDSTQEELWSLINVLSLQDYLKAVVPSEVFWTWPLASLQSQSVAARSYALRHSLNARRLSPPRPWDVDPTTCFQSYRGIATEKPTTSEAVDLTRDQVVTWQDQPNSPVEIAETLYSAHSGGYVASSQDSFGAALGYLPHQPDVVGVNDPQVVGEVGLSAATWRQSINNQNLAQWLSREMGWSLDSNVNGGVSLEVLQRNLSRRVQVLAISGRPIGSDLTTQMRLRDQLRRSFGLRTNYFYLNPVVGGAQTVSGFGLGHGVGMSQWGSYVMASRGASYLNILGYYYPGAVVRAFR